MDLDLSEIRGDGMRPDNPAYKYFNILRYFKSTRRPFFSCSSRVSCSERGSPHVMRQLTCKAEHKQKIKTVTLANFLSPTRFEDYTRLRPLTKHLKRLNTTRSDLTAFCILIITRLSFQFTTLNCYLASAFRNILDL